MEIFPGIHLTSNGLVCIMHNKLNIEYRRLCHLLFIIDYLLFLCSPNNSVNRCKSVSNRKLFEKTKPIYSFSVLRTAYCDKIKERVFEKTKPMLIWAKRYNGSNSKGLWGF